MIRWDCKTRSQPLTGLSARDGNRVHACLAGTMLLCIPLSDCHFTRLPHGRWFVSNAWQPCPPVGTGALPALPLPHRNIDVSHEPRLHPRTTVPGRLPPLLPVASTPDTTERRKPLTCTESPLRAGLLSGPFPRWSILSITQVRNSDSQRLKEIPEPRVCGRAGTQGRAARALVSVLPRARLPRVGSVTDEGR